MDQSAASGGDNEDEPAPVRPVQPRRILRAKSVLARTVNRNASGLAGRLVPAHQKPSSSSIFLSSPAITRHTRLESSNDTSQNPLSTPESSSNGSHLQSTAVTSKRRTRSSNNAGMRASPDLNIITENESRIETGAVSHSRAARSGLPAGRDNGRTEARRGARFGLSGVIFKAGRWRGKTRWKGTRSGTRFRLLGVIFEIGGWRGQLVGQLVTVLIFVCVCT